MSTDTVNDRNKYKVKRYKTLFKNLIAIAEHGNDYQGLSNHAEELEVGNVIAEIQNWLGENRILLEKFNLNYNSAC